MTGSAKSRVSMWRDEWVRDEAPGLRKGRNKGIAAAARLARRLDAERRAEERAGSLQARSGQQEAA